MTFLGLVARRTWSGSTASSRSTSRGAEVPQESPQEGSLSNSRIRCSYRRQVVWLQLCSGPDASHAGNLPPGGGPPRNKLFKVKMASPRSKRPSVFESQAASQVGASPPLKRKLSEKIGSVKFVFELPSQSPVKYLKPGGGFGVQVEKSAAKQEPFC